MHNLAIVSRDHAIYQSLYEQYKDSLPSYQLIYCGPAPSEDVLKHANIVLSEPDVAAKFIDQCKAMMWLQSTWAGNNKLQQHAKRDYLLTGVKGIFSAQMREYVMAYILHFQRRIPDFLELQSRRQWHTLDVTTLEAKTLGIMGLGSIGMPLAHIAQSFGMHINAISRSSRDLSSATYYSTDDILRFAQTSDYIVNLLPETENSIGLCDEQFFAHMKNTAVFINAGRGSILRSDQVLVNALANKQIKAAVLDVFPEEPLDSNSALYDAPNCMITNHSAAVSKPEKVFEVFLDNLDRLARQEELRYVHDFTRGY
ncbi:D-2-hydroxyacid dehydrogenase [Glaciecola sp. XM2]|uniref:D-2-hydroxyacid dehydrogenase n=1 Tax=Glaciecola sp. XM2 TaxID=1914931 RepID=UPI001BDE1151|nr:D-2-hydroxyacid dehydrogenase [Glaciecola sp. XM2]MBT1452510.1 D-2-hydroxyacid dehydrogenase [Glaciecola sp. XM2]